MAMPEEILSPNVVPRVCMCILELRYLEEGQPHRL